MAKKEYEPIYKNNVRINDARGVNRLLQRVINALIQDQISESKARTIGYLANITLKGLELEELENDKNSGNTESEIWVQSILKLYERRKNLERTNNENKRTNNKNII